MIFNSLHFLVFFLVITLWFFRMQTQKERLWLLLVGSCYFYMSFVPAYILILGGTIVIDYLAGLQIDRSEGRSRKVWLITSLIANIGVLAVFKYYNFFIDNIQNSFHFFGKPLSLPLLQMVLPIGLSFHTFQAMSYTIEVYRKNQPAEKNFLLYSVYVMFYPQLVAGPIERPQNILHQLREYRAYDWENTKEGLSRILWGFFKKVVVADRLAVVADHTFANMHTSSSVTLFIGAVFYTFQIYGDFSGYSDIAIGAAKVMNIKLMDNFNQPVFAKSISDFWRRWHISLYSWFNDYLFNPIVTSLRHWGASGISLAILLTFAISGLWHGAAWHHILYGVIHACALIYEYLTRKYRKRLFSKLPRPLDNSLSIVITLLFVIFSRIFFRAPDVPAAITYLKGIFTAQCGSNYLGLGSAELAFSVLIIVAMTLREKFIPAYSIKNNVMFYCFAIIMTAICYYFGVFSENQFIYFQF